MADMLVPDDFRALEAPLQVDRGDGAAPVELSVVSVEVLPTHRLRVEPFSLILRGPRTPMLAQATYAVRHPRHGTIEVFLVPIGQDADSSRYEATFN